jgi:hypothetical protein
MPTLHKNMRQGKLKLNYWAIAGNWNIGLPFKHHSVRSGSIKILPNKKRHNS